MGNPMIELVGFLLLCFVWYKFYLAARLPSSDTTVSKVSQWRTGFVALGIFNLWLLLTAGHIDFNCSFLLRALIINVVITALPLGFALVRNGLDQWDGGLSSFQRGRTDSYIAFLLIFGWVPLWLLFVLFSD